MKRAQQIPGSSVRWSGRLWAEILGLGIKADRYHFPQCQLATAIAHLALNRVAVEELFELFLGLEFTV